MSRRPSMLGVAVRVCRWADEQRIEPLGEKLVPGASVAERRRLATLGAVVGVLAEGCTARWPPALAEWASAGPEPPAKLIAELLTLLEDGGDPLAAIYERAVRPRNRRRLGTFFTPPVLVDHMLARAEVLLGHAPDVVVDPGAGVGAYSLAAARRWPAARVIAVDINLVTLGLLAARLGREGVADRTQLVLADFLPWLDDVERGDDAVWLYLGNPPFTRTQSLDRDTKDVAQRAAGHLVTSGHATLSTFFAAAIVSRLRAQDAACLLLPAAWTHTRSARELRAGLWERRRRPLELHRWPTTARAFTGPDVTATVVGLGAETKGDQPYHFGRAALRQGSIAIVGQQTRTREAPCPDPLPGGAGRRTTQPPPATVPLSMVFRVRRGLASGANRFFFVDRETAAELPDTVRRPGLLTLRLVDLDGPVLDQDAWNAMLDAGHRCVLIDVPPAAEEDPAVAAYLARGEDAKLHLRYLCADRSPWYALEHVEPPELLLAPLMADRTVRLIRNDVAAVPSNSLYGLYRRPGVGDHLAERVAEWLRSEDGRLTLQGHARRLRGGSLKLEPGDVKALPIPEALLDRDTAEPGQLVLAT